MKNLAQWIIKSVITRVSEIAQKCVALLSIIAFTRQMVSVLENRRKF
jgi:hypothetical protein